MSIIEEIEQEHLKKDLPSFCVGDTVRVHIRIIEGNKERIQVFEGIVIGKQGSGLSEAFCVYRHAYGSSMEKLFLLHSPKIQKIEVVRAGKTKRAKLYHLRGKKGKKAKVKERLFKKPVKQVKEEPKETAPSEETSSES
ncbi:MAG: 50S ribosomal protein L19 [Chlamydiota bacterium]